MRRYVIYLLSDRQGRGYVGQTCRPLEQRVRQHQTDAARLPARAVHRWLRELHVTGQQLLVKVLDRCDAIEAANEAERRWIATCANAGVALQNRSRGGQRFYGPEHGETIALGLATPTSKALRSSATKRRHEMGFMSEESKRRMGAGQKASWTPERKAAQAARWADPEWRARTLAKQKAAFAKPEVKARMSRSQRASKGATEHRERVRQQARRQWADPLKRAEISARIGEAFATPEKREEMRERTAALWRDPAHRAKVIAAKDAACRDPAVRAKMSAAAREAWRRRKGAPHVSA